jgi:hypothetical protein
VGSGIRITAFIMKYVSGLSRALYLFCNRGNKSPTTTKSMTLQVGRKRIQTKASSRVNISFWDLLLLGKISSGNGLIAPFSRNDTTPSAWYLGIRNNAAEVGTEDKSSKQ